MNGACTGAGKPASEALLADPLSKFGKSPTVLYGHRIGLLVTDGTRDDVLTALRRAAEKEGASVAIVATSIGGISTRDGARVATDHALSMAPSALFDAVALAPSKEGVRALLAESPAISWLRDAFTHLRVIGHVRAAKPLFDQANIGMDAEEGIVAMEGSHGPQRFFDLARTQHLWMTKPWGAATVEAIRADGTASRRDGM
ncbi:hypothetical protein [Aquisalimonas sp.]|uniref:hypothetical protein n=1 Tax=Aquisalimonas sp. TaxID=1872621 RepID=UPI0025BCDA5F|nr:hypothetical protein [Aquisalimonas sp.]